MARIVLVEDDDDVRTSLRELLVLEGHDVQEASDGRAAERLMRAGAADVLLSDVFMPELDGIDLLMRLRHYCPDAKLIVMSGGGSIGSRSVLDVARALGAHATLSKPIQIDQLRDAIDTALSASPGPTPTRSA